MRYKQLNTQTLQHKSDANTTGKELLKSLHYIDTHRYSLSVGGKVAELIAVTSTECFTEQVLPSTVHLTGIQTGETDGVHDLCLVHTYS